MQQRIAIGFSTVLGTLGAVAAVIIPLIGELADAAEPLGVPAQTWVIVGAVLASLVILGRMGQAVATVLRGGETILAEPPPGKPTDVQADTPR